MLRATVRRVSGWQILRVGSGAATAWHAVALGPGGDLVARHVHGTQRAAEAFAAVNPRPRGA